MGCNHEPHALFLLLVVEEEVFGEFCLSELVLKLDFLKHLRNGGHWVVSHGLHLSETGKVKTVACQCGKTGLASV